MTFSSGEFKEKAFCCSKWKQKSPFLLWSEVANLHLASPVGVWLLVILFLAAKCHLPRLNSLRAEIPPQSWLPRPAPRQALIHGGNLSVRTKHLTSTSDQGGIGEMLCPESLKIRHPHGLDENQT